MIAGMTIYQILWFFLTYSLMGWIIEVMFHAVAVGKVINRGFLNGPVCPVYGFGMLAVLASYNTAQSAGLVRLNPGSPDLKNILILFIGGLILATAVELLAGFLLDMCFHMRWWDYSDKPFNFHGYICLEFSIIWGLGITAVVYLLHPLLAGDRSVLHIIPEKYGVIILSFLYLVFTADAIVTIAVVIGLNKRLTELDKIRTSMRIVSDRMSRGIANSTIKASQKIGEGQVQAALAKAELKTAVSETGHNVAVRSQEIRISGMEKLAAGRDELEQRYNELEHRYDELKKEITSNRIFGMGRIIKGLPRQSYIGARETLKELMEKLENQRWK